ncbi:MAG: alpha/beta fold hydrolase [Microcystaceae cyanobacterium]
MPTLSISGVPHLYEFTVPPNPPTNPVLVFIHGWLLSHRYWQPLIEQLSPAYSCLSYDLRGFGQSQPITSDEDPYSLAAYAQDLKELLQQLDIEQAWVIGHSLGGSIALWGADSCEERVKGVIGVNMGGGIYIKEEFERFRKAGEQIVKFRPPWLPYVPFLDLLFSRMMVATPIPRQWGKQRVKDFAIADQRAALGSLLDSTTESEVHSLPQLVSRLKQPVYFFAGQEDMVMELKYVRYLASFHWLFDYQGLNIFELPNCGHFAMLEQTHLLADKIDNIVSKHG